MAHTHIWTSLSCRYLKTTKEITMADNSLISSISLFICLSHNNVIKEFSQITSIYIFSSGLIVKSNPLCAFFSRIGLVQLWLKYAALRIVDSVRVT